MNAKRWTLTVVSAATAMLMLDIAVVNTAIPHMAKDLHAGLGSLQWVIDAYTLALAATVLTTGSLADRFGRRRLFAAGFAVFTASSVWCALSGTMVMLDVARAVQGIGAAAMFSTSLALLANAYPEAKERAGALAVYGASIGAAFAIGPLVGGALTSAFGWRSIFLINVPVGLVALWSTVTRVRESRDPAARRVDVPGQVTLTAGLFLLVLGLLRGNEDGWGATHIVAELGAAVVLLAAFVVIELRSREPMLPLRYFRIPSFAGAQVAALAISCTFFAGYVYVTLYMQNILGFSAIQAGLTYLPGTILLFVVSGATASLGEKVSARAMVAGGLALVVIGMLLVVALTTTTSGWWAVQPGLMIASIGGGLFNPALTAVALGSLTDQQSGLAAGVNDTFRQGGIAIGVAALGAFIPTDALAPHSTAFVDGLHTAFLAASAVAAIGVVAVALLIRGDRTPAEPAVLVGTKLAAEAA